MSIKAFMAQVWQALPQNPINQTIFGVEQFKSALNVYGIQPTNLYRVSIASPRVLSNYNLFNQNPNRPTLSPNPDAGRILGFYCTDINIPGISLATTEIRRYGVGAFQRMPYTPIFADTTFTFLADGTGNIHTFFNDWMRNIVNYSMGRQSFGASSYNTFNGAAAYEVSYKADYESPGITIEVFDKTGRLQQVITMYQAYPINIGEVTMSYSTTDDIARIPITFTFRDYEVVYSNQQPSPIGPPILSQRINNAFYAAGETVGGAIRNAAAGIFSN